MRSLTRWILGVGLSGAATGLIAGPAGGPDAEFAARMEAGRKTLRTYHYQRIAEAPRAARAEFEKAAELAGNDQDKARAFLALAEAWHADRLNVDREIIRRLCEQVLALDRAGPSQKGEAAVRLGDTWRDEGQYERARAAYARVTNARADPILRASVLHDAYSKTARAWLREGALDEARRALDEWLAADQLTNAPALRADTDSLKEVIRLAGTWRALRRTRTESVMAALRQARAPGERARAAYTLGLLGVAEGVPDLVAALRAERPDVRCEAAAALGRIGDRRAAAALAAALGDGDAQVRRAAAAALGKIGDPQAVDALTARLTDGDEDVRRASARALAAMADPRAASALAGLRQNPDPALRRAAIQGLARAPAGEAAPLLIEALGDADQEVRRRAAAALGRADAAVALDPLITALRDGHWRVRRTAAEALGRFGDARAVQPLVPLDTDSNLAVKQAARRSLETLTGETVQPMNWQAWWDRQPRK